MEPEALFERWHFINVLPRWVFSSGGLLPIGTGIASRVYRCFIAMAVVLIVPLSVVLAVGDPGNAPSVHLSIAFYAWGAALGLFSLRNHAQEIVGKGVALEMYARSQGFLDQWCFRSACRLFVLFFLWFASGLCRFFFMFFQFEDGYDWQESGRWPSFLSSLFVSAIFIVISFLQLHVCLGLEVMIDDFGYNFFENSDVSQALISWNIIQAMLRRTSRVLEFSLICMQTSVLGALMLSGIELYDEKGPLTHSASRAVLWSLPMSSYVVISLYVLLRAATVTEKCSRVPSLINSIAIDCHTQELDRDAFAIVDYVTNSAAGFYVKGVRLRYFMVLKLMYFLGIALLTLVTRTLRQA
jgi:hypothetical protein